MNCWRKLGKLYQKANKSYLFQNRRGFSPYVECMTCGHVPHCPSCDVKFDVLQIQNQLRCHYCGHSIANQRIVIVANQLI